MSEAFAGFFATPGSEAQYINLEEVVAALHMEQGSSGTEMVFDTAEEI